jgi:hypothetical protein
VGPLVFRLRDGVLERTCAAATRLRETHAGSLGGRARDGGRTHGCLGPRSGVQPVQRAVAAAWPVQQGRTLCWAWGLICFPVSGAAAALVQRRRRRRRRSGKTAAHGVPAD